jgi:hypothetical protein
MSALGGIGQLVDGFVGVFSPGTELKRMVARERLNSARNPANGDDTTNPWGQRYATYAAAKSDRLTGGWSPVNEDVNKIIGAASWRVRGRVRQLVRDFPYFMRATGITDYVVGEGIMLQSRIAAPDGTLYKNWIQAKRGLQHE